MDIFNHTFILLAKKKHHFCCSLNGLVQDIFYYKTILSDFKIRPRAAADNCWQLNSVTKSLFTCSAGPQSNRGGSTFTSPLMIIILIKHVFVQMRVFPQEHLQIDSTLWKLLINSPTAAALKRNQRLFTQSHRPASVSCTCVILKEAAGRFI